MSAVPFNYHVTSHCRACGRERADDERFSKRGKCADCRVARFVSNLIAEKDHAGPEFLHWRRRVAASVGAVLREDIEAERQADAA